MLQALKKIIKEVVEKKSVRLVEVILFGSRAKGNSENDSDWDILVIVDRDLTQQERKEVWYSVYKELHKNFPEESFDIIVKSKRVYEEERETVNTISNEAFLEGIKL